MVMVIKTVKIEDPLLLPFQMNRFIVALSCNFLLIVDTSAKGG